MKIIYLHGFNSNKDSETGKRIAKPVIKGKYPEVITLSYNYLNAEKGFEDINKVILETLKIDSNILLIGTSLGGFWANYFAQKYNLKMILINPAIVPSLSLGKYVGTVKNYNTGKEEIFSNTASYRNYEEKIEDNFYRVVILGEQDEVMNSKISEIAFKNKAKVILINEGHRLIKEESFKVLFDEIFSASVTFPENLND